VNSAKASKRYARSYAFEPANKTVILTGKIAGPLAFLRSNLHNLKPMIVYNLIGRLELNSGIEIADPQQPPAPLNCPSEK
jgi:hypothetical protein